MNGEWNNEFGEVNLIKEIKLRSWLKASFYDNWKNAGAHHKVNTANIRKNIK